MKLTWIYGKAIYKFDIKSANGKAWEVEVVTGKIVGHQEEVYQIELG